MRIVFLHSLLLVLLSLFFFHLVQCQFGIDKNPDDIVFYFYPNRGDPHYYPILNYKPEATPPQGYILQGPTRFLSHGYQDDAFNNQSMVLIKNAFLASNQAGNVIMIDWSKLNRVPGVSSDIGDIITYPLIARDLHIVSRRIAEFIINYTRAKIMHPEHIHLIGHSLGAHVMGEVGHHIQVTLGTPIARISGLDPAGPGFWPPFFSLDRALRSTDAIFVDVTHSNIGGFGQVVTSGHVDFYPNGGVVQPGREANSTSRQRQIHEKAIL